METVYNTFSQPVFRHQNQSILRNVSGKCSHDTHMFQKLNLFENIGYEYSIKFLCIYIVCVRFWSSMQLTQYM